MSTRERPLNPMPKGRNVLRVSEINRMADAIERISGVQGVNVDSGSTGLIFKDKQPDWFWAKVTAKDGSSPKKYSWTLVYPDGSGGWVEPPGAASGTASNLPAYEMNGVDMDVTSPVYVKMFIRTNSMMFEDPKGGTTSGISGLTFKEQDGSPSYTSTTTVEVNQTDGFVLTQPSANTVLISIQDASASTMGIVSTGAQTFAGNKTFQNNVDVDGTLDVNQAVHFASTLDVDSDAVVGAFLYLGGTTSGTAFGKFRATNNIVQVDLLDGIGGTTGSYTLSDNSGVLYFTLYDQSTGITDAAYRLNIGGVMYTGDSGTDALGNVFTGGICTTVGTGSISSYTDEQARDAIGTALTAGSGISIVVDDGGDTITISTSITQYTDEMARDALGTALTEGYLIDIAVNDGSDTITLEKKFRGCSAYRSATGNAPGFGSVWGSVAFDIEKFDTDSIHDNATNNSRFTIPTGMDGYWDIRGFIYPDYNGNAAGSVVQVRLLLNGATVIDQRIAEVLTSGSIPISSVGKRLLLSAGDYLELQMYHTGAANMLYFNNETLTWMECEFQGVAP